jgi:uncharacterized protein (DUF952 family)
MPEIYHITTSGEWNKGKQKGFYENDSLKEEGFIHCSQEPQIAGVLKRFFAGKTDLVKLVINTDKLSSRFVFEWSSSMQDTFPHIYGPINLEAVIEVMAL